MIDTKYLLVNILKTNVFSNDTPIPPIIDYLSSKSEIDYNQLIYYRN